MSRKKEFCSLCHRLLWLDLLSQKHQAVGRTSQDIDSKVCNKKVAVDDEVPEGARDALLEYGSRVEVRPPKGERWSCVDYVDTIHKENRKATKRRGAARPNADGLRERFGELDGHDARRGDKVGQCQESLAVGPDRGDTPLAISVSCIFRGESHRQEGDTHRWYKGKQTNRGWPGTAEGKINTAQGMAGDLVGKLTDDEKATVAGILTRVVSGAEVVEIRAISTASVMLNACYDRRAWCLLRCDLWVCV